MIFHGPTRPDGLHRGDRQLDLLVKGGRVIYCPGCDPSELVKQWLDANTRVKVVMVQDSDADWMEVEVTVPDEFAGSPADGWTAGSPQRIRLQWSSDLLSWSEDGWSTAPGKPPTDNGDGTMTWYGRHAVPRRWVGTRADYSLDIAHRGKSVTGMRMHGSAVPLPSAPYALPAEIATFEADLQAHFPGSTATIAGSHLEVFIPQSQNINLRHGGFLIYDPADVYHTPLGTSVVRTWQLRKTNETAPPDFIAPAFSSDKGFARLKLSQD